MATTLCSLRGCAPRVSVGVAVGVWARLGSDFNPQFSTCIIAIIDYARTEAPAATDTKPTGLHLSGHASLWDISVPVVECWI